MRAPIALMPITKNEVPARGAQPSLAEKIDTLTAIRTRLIEFRTLLRDVEGAELATTTAERTLTAEVVRVMQAEKLDTAEGNLGVATITRYPEISTEYAVLTLLVEPKAEVAR